eukprot:SAG31_NODE_595_length_13695_cov_11.446896_9_plen_153_part_00
MVYSFLCCRGSSDAGTENVTACSIPACATTSVICLAANLREQQADPDSLLMRSSLTGLIDPSDDIAESSFLSSMQEAESFSGRDRSANLEQKGFFPEPRAVILHCSVWHSLGKVLWRIGSDFHSDSVFGVVHCAKWMQMQQRRSGGQLWLQC